VGTGIGGRSWAAGAGAAAPARGRRRASLSVGAVRERVLEFLGRKIRIRWNKSPLERRTVSVVHCIWGRRGRHGCVSGTVQRGGAREAARSVHRRRGHAHGGVQVTVPAYGRDQIAHTAAQSTARERRGAAQRQGTHGGVERTEAMPAAKKACRWRWVALEDTRSSTKRLSKERRGGRCAYAWENAARTEQSRLGECEAAVVGEQTRRSRNRVVVLLSHTLNELVGWAWLAERSDGRDGGFGVSWCDQLESRGVEPLPPSASRV
jgi:hypothetical protein